MVSDALQIFGDHQKIDSLICLIRRCFQQADHICLYLIKQAVYSIIHTDDFFSFFQILGNKEMREGTFDYYMREPIVKNEAKGVAPLILAYIEILLREKASTQE
jgi:hypothetical protein